MGDVQLKQQVEQSARTVKTLDERVTALEACLGSDRLDMLHGVCADLQQAVEALNKRIDSIGEKCDGAKYPKPGREHTCEGNPEQDEGEPSDGTKWVGDWPEVAEK